METEIIFGYGSLMSYQGLHRSGKGVLNKITPLNAFMIRIEEGIRGFAKPKESHLCMDLDYYSLKGEVIDGDTPRGEGVEGLSIEIPQDDFKTYCRREGYSRSYKLLDAVPGKYGCVGEFLWEKFKENASSEMEDSIRKYRQRLSEIINYTSRDYIPHPICLGDSRYAITFIAPGKYGTGSDLRSEKELEEIFEVKNASQVLQRIGTNKATFLKYYVECVLGGVHGIDVRDLIKPLGKNSSFYEKVRQRLIGNIKSERRSFISQIADGIENYEENFGPLETNLERSGILEKFADILKGWHPTPQFPVRSFGGD